MSHGREYVERTTITETPSSRETVRQFTPTTARNSAGWWIAAIVAIVAVVGVVLLFNSQSNEAELQAARDRGMAEANLAAATTDAQQAALQASQAAQSAVASTAQASQRAAQAAQAAANQTALAARSAGDAARDVTTIEIAPSEPAPAPAPAE